MTRFALAVLLCLVTMTGAWAQAPGAGDAAPAPADASEPDHAIHEELRGLLKTIQESINSGQYDAMQPAFSDDLRITSITQEFVNTKPGLTEYFDKWFGPDKKLKELHMEFRPEALTELSADKTWGVSYGTGTEKYTLNNGSVYDMPTRWTATVVKDPDGHWRIRTMHIGTDFLDNPVLAEVEKAAKTYPPMAGGAGLVIGLLLGFLLGRRRAG